MTAAWEADWSGRLRSIGESLLAIEVNTVEKASMSAQKMPDVPLALHAIIDSYNLYLTGLGYALDKPLCDMAAARINLPANTTPADEKQAMDALGLWFPSANAAPAPELTNGPGTFEALQWAAWAAMRDMAKLRDEALVPRGDAIFDLETSGILGRIRANSRQLREVSILLARDHPTAANRLPLFGVTIEAAVRALLNNPLPPLSVRPDVLVLIRKAWDVGTETVMMQSSMQIDGDLVMRISPRLTDAKREFFASLHNASVKTGLGQWQSLFGLIRDLAGELGKAIWGLV